MPAVVLLLNALGLLGRVLEDTRVMRPVSAAPEADALVVTFGLVGTPWLAGGGRILAALDRTPLAPAPTGVAASDDVG